MELNSTKYPNNSRTLTSGTHIVYKDDVSLNCNTSTGPITINLGTIPANYWSTTYKLYINDSTGNASVNNITIVAPAGFKINSQQNLVLNTNYQSVLIRITSNTDYLSYNAASGITQAYTTVQDEGVALPQRSTIDFVGTGVTATDNGSKTLVTINNPTLYYQTVQDEGVSLPQQPILNFVGAGVNVTNGEDKTIVTINDCCSFVELTNSQMLELIANGTVNPGTYYKITNPINADEGVIVQGIVTNANSTLQGSGIFLNADYQGVGNYSGVSGYAGNLGIWSSIPQTVVAGNVVIWGNRHWKNLAGNWGSALNENSLDDNWLLLPKNTTNGYIREVDFIKYNVSINLVIYRADKRLNEVEYQYPIIDAISVFQWGRDVVKDNKVFSASSIQCTNSYCSFIGNHLTNESGLVDTSNINSLGYEVKGNTLTTNSNLNITNNTGSIAYNTLNKSSITITTNNGTLDANFLNSNSGINITNNQGSIIGNNLNYGFITLVDNIGNVINNSLNTGAINVNYNDNAILANTITSNAGISIVGVNNSTIFSNLVTNRGLISCASDTFFGVIDACTIDAQEIFLEYFTTDQLGKIINTGYSNFEIYLNLSSPSVYNASLETLTIPHRQFGRIYLTNATSNIISKINNLEQTRSTRISIYNNTYIETYAIFQHTVIASVTDGDLVCDAPNSAITLVGRYMGSDFIEYQKNVAVLTANYVNLRTNLVKLA